jgi:hypothetical protein
MIGKIVEGISDAFLPEPVGDILSGAANLLTGNIDGAIEDGVDLFTGSSGPSDGVDREPSESDMELLDKGIKPDWMTDKQFKMHQLQQDVQNRNLFVETFSNLSKSAYDSAKAVAGNLRA